MQVAEEDNKFLMALRAVSTIAKANFPSDCEIVVTAKGAHSATVTLPAYTFDRLLIPAQMICGGKIAM